MWRGTDDADEDERELTPEEEAAFRVGLERVQEEKREALVDPGPSWREWFFYDAMKWWLGIVFLIADAWVVTSWISDGVATATDIVGVVLSLAAALYLEVLLYRYLWRRPSDPDLVGRGTFRPGWKALREVGRWTPEASRVASRAARRRPEQGGVDPNEFL
ncbi:MAG TPA: hypothetical protein VMH49_04540 [Thermoplasmata archaeon]|nr:hypothetical protein [Thermoplasmata archaeon]